MIYLQSSSKQTAWQIARAKIFLRFCRQIQSRKTLGDSINTTAKRICRRWNGKTLKCDPSRRLSVSPATLFKHYRAWRLSGENFDSLFLKYVASNRRLPAAVVVRFVNFCADRDFPSFKAAWLAFCRRGGNAGPGRVNGKPLALGYDALAWNLPKGFWIGIKRNWETIRQAEREIALLRIETIAEVIRRMPAKVRKNPTFEI